MAQVGHEPDHCGADQLPLLEQRSVAQQRHCRDAGRSCGGRIQQFRFAGDTNGAFWESASASGFYRNYGGDKAWPSPQSDWNWPPPRGFDGTPGDATFTNGIATLTTRGDASYGIRVTRTIGLVSKLPIMLVRTVFERTAAPTRADKELGIWIDCQAAFDSASRCYVPVPSPSLFANGYTTTGSSMFSATLPVEFTNANSLISFGRDPRASHKLGFDGNILALVGASLTLRVDAPRIAGATYPDGNSSSEVYTCNDPGPYMELELMGPMSKLPVGGQMEFVMMYSLFRRSAATTDAEAQKVLAWHY